MKKKIIKNHKGGDGYTINVNEAIGGMPAFSRYSNNYRPVFVGDLLQNGSGKKNCNCKKDKSIYNLIRLKGGNKNIKQINQFDAIRKLSKNIEPLKINSLKKLITKLFFKTVDNKKYTKLVKYGGSTHQLQNILAPLGKNNLLVIASLLLLHYFAVESKKDNNKSTIKKDKKIKKRKIMRGGESFLGSLTKILAPTGINSFGASVILIGLQRAFVQPRKNIKKMKGGLINKKGGNSFKNLIAPLGTNAFIATGLLIVLEKLFSKKIKEIKTKDSKKKKLIGGQISKNREELFNLVAPITFNTFATKSMLEKFISNSKK
jgi:hypothetical protein